MTIPARVLNYTQRYGALRRCVVVRTLSSSAAVPEDSLLYHESSSASSQSVASSSSSRRPRRPIYVSATRQHVGKTSTSLALVSGLMKRFESVGFMKPVGQKFLTVQDKDGKSLRIDKDAVLVKQHFGLDHVQYADMNPVLIPKGYTRDYLDGKITLDMQKERILNSYQRVLADSDVLLCEGTGHTAVGSVVDISNAEVASLLNARMVLVVNGGIGKAMDELEINKVFCDKFGVDIAGVIVNRVEPEKYEQVKHYLGQALREKWGVPLIGLVPDRPFLGCPAIADMERLFEGSQLVSGNELRMRHYTVQELQLVATSLEVFLRNLKRDPERTLYVCHASRNDILLGFLMESQQRGPQWEAAMIVTGSNDYPISRQVMDIVTSMKDAPPVLMVPKQTHQVMEAIHSFTPKLHSEDANRVSVAVNHYEPFIDFDLLLQEEGDAAAEA